MTRHALQLLKVNRSKVKGQGHKVTWRISRQKRSNSAVYAHIVTVIPPTQEVAVLGSRKNTVRVRNYSSRVNSLCFYSSLHNVTASLLITLLPVHALAYSSTDRLRKTPTNRPPLVYISIPGLIEASGTFQDILEHSRTFESFAGPPGAGTF